MAATGSVAEYWCYDVRVAIKIQVTNDRLGVVEGGGIQGDTSEIDCYDLR